MTKSRRWRDAAWFIFFFFRPSFQCSPVLFVARAPIASDWVFCLSYLQHFIIALNNHFITLSQTSKSPQSHRLFQSFSNLFVLECVCVKSLSKQHSLSSEVRLIGSHSDKCSVNCEIMLSKTFCFVILAVELSVWLSLSGKPRSQLSPEHTEHTFKVFVVDLQVRAGLSESSLYDTLY